MTNRYRTSLSPLESRILSDLAFKGKSLFTPRDLATYGVDTKRFLRRLRKKGWIAWVKRNLYLIAPLEAGPKGAASHTVHSFVLAAHLVHPYYVGFWSALNYHGMTEATPLAVYVATTKPRSRRPILDVPFIFVTLRPWKMFGTQTIGIEDDKVVISDREKTLIDCLDHPEHAGGIIQVAEAVAEEFVSLDFDRVLRYARRSRNSTILKRLGYLLELAHYQDEAERIEALELGEGYSKLDPELPNRGPTNERWKLRINIPASFLGGSH